MKINYLLYSTLLLFFFILLHAQENQTIKGNGNIVSKKHETTSYDAITINNNIDVVLIEGNEGSITLKGDQNLVDQIEVVSIKGELKLSSKNQVALQPSKGNDLTAIIPAQSVSKLIVNGAGTFGGTFPIEGHHVKLKVNEAGNLSVNVDATNVKAIVTGNGSINISGKTGFLDAAVTGSGSIDGQELYATNCHGRVIGSGDLIVYAKDRLDAKVVGSGSIEVNSSVATVDKDLMGSGKIVKR